MIHRFVSRKLNEEQSSKLMDWLEANRQSIHSIESALRGPDVAWAVTMDDDDNAIYFKLRWC